MTNPPSAYLHDAAAPDDLYAGKPPWDIDRPQPALLALASAGAITGRVLDAGCGTGEHVLMAAGLGLDATGIDLAAKALDVARDKARERGLPARFLRRDALKLADLGEYFNTVLDCGLFHHIGERGRPAYVDGVRDILVTGGRYYMLLLGEHQHDAGHSHQATVDDVTTAFSSGFRVDSVDPVTVDTTTDPDGLPAWLVALTRI